VEDGLAGNAYEYALNLLSARAYTVRNLRRKLVQKEFDTADVDSAIERLTASRLVDDERFAMEYARQKLVTGATSPRRVERELLKRGIASGIARSSVAAVIEEEGVDTSASAESVARKKMRSLDGLETDVQKKRLFGFLARRGFGLDEIRRAVAIVLK
jgi:regulatory protein